ncbi:hypothetical protein [Paraburkholderia nemoris]|uniref:hypothetical protein n=1 Tax=Paraburkholderia nemoris TaxID=2793076 RepID=UPI001B8C643B|nr:hypothetical protein [Paraburkholderia nemoris]
MTDTCDMKITPDDPTANQFDAVCRQVRSATHASCAAVIVIDGNGGSGYSVIGPLETQALLPSILEQMAHALRTQLKHNLQ